MGNIPLPTLRNTPRILLRYWLPPFIYAAVIFYFSSIPGTDFLPQFFSADKVLHLLEYALLGYLLARALVYYQLRERTLVVSVVLLGLAYGVSDEVHQLFVPHRSPSVIDAIADGIGSFLGVMLYSWRRGGR